MKHIVTKRNYKVGACAMALALCCSVGLTGLKVSK